MDISKTSDRVHAEAERLLPWYLTGRLSTDETGLVDAHLKTCEACRQDVAAERRLQADWIAMDPEAEATGWGALQTRIMSRSQPMRPASRRLVARIAARPRLALGFAVAQAAAFAVVFMVAQPPTADPDAYITLGETTAEAPGNAIIVFNPQATEREMREALNVEAAVIVGGPTATNAYILRLPDPDRTDRLRRLRAVQVVVLAEAIDGESVP